MKIRFSSTWNSDPFHGKQFPEMKIKQIKLNEELKGEHVDINVKS